jgi:hypothetical protein
MILQFFSRFAAAKPRVLFMSPRPTIAVGGIQRLAFSVDWKRIAILGGLYASVAKARGALSIRERHGPAKGKH